MLPTNKKIKALLSIKEITAQMNEGDYSAELLLQHLAVHWNRLEKWKNLSPAELRLHCGEMSAQEIRTVKAVLNAISQPEVAGNPEILSMAEAKEDYIFDIENNHPNTV